MRYIYRRVFIGMLCLMPLVGDAATVTVALSGNDANPCTAPKRTIAAGLQCLSAGDTLVVQDGTYPELIANTIPAGIDPAHPTIVKAQHAGGVNLNPDGGHGGLPGATVTIARSNIVFDGFRLDCTNQQGNVCLGLHGDGLHDVTVQNTEIFNLLCQGGCPDGGAGIKTGPTVGSGGFAGNIVIRNNHIHHIAWGIQDNKVHCLYISTGNTTFSGNEIDHCEGFGIHQYNTDPGTQADNNVYQGNLIHHTTTRAGILLSSGSNVRVEGNCIRDTAGEGIYVGDYGATNRNQQVVNNLILSNAQACVLIGDTDHPTVRGNTCFQNGHDVILNERGVQSVIEGNLLGVAPASGTCAAPVQVPLLTRLPAPRNLRLRTLP